MPYVYIIHTATNKYYTGITNNLSNRLQQHITNSSNFTRHNNFHCIYSVIYVPTLSAARRLEVRIKRTGASRFLSRHKDCILSLF